MLSLNNNNKIFVISDLHLSGNLEIFTKFTQQYANTADELYILGDLFNFYLGDKFISSYYQNIIYLLKNLSKTTKIFIMSGNRDFLIGNIFAKQSGATIIQEPYILQNSLHNFVLIHGDSLVTDDKGYQRFKKIIQSKSMRFILTILHKSIIIKIANIIKALSQQSKNKKSRNIMDINEKSLLDFMLNYPNTDIIHGHTHRQNIHKYKHFKRFVLGDWGKKEGNFLQIINNEIKFIKF